MRAHALLALVVLTALLAVSVLGNEWKLLNTRVTLLGDAAALAKLVSAPAVFPPAPPRLPAPSEALGPFGPAAGLESYAWPLVFFLVFGALWFLTPSSPAARSAPASAERAFLVNPRDGSVTIRTGLGFTISLAAFERYPDGSLSLQALVSNNQEAPLSLVRLSRAGAALAELRDLKPGEIRSAEVAWGSVGGGNRLSVEAGSNEELRRLAVSLPWDELVQLFLLEKSVVLREAREVGAPAMLEAEEEARARERQREVLEKLHRKAAEERRAAEELVVRVPFQPLLPELGPGVSLLIEGPVASKKAELALALANEQLKQNRSLAWCSFDPERDAQALPAEKLSLVSRVPAVLGLEEIGIGISKMAQQKPSLVVFDLLYRYAPKYPLETLLKFLTFNVGKLREAGVPSAWLVESTLEPAALAALEGEFDAVIEFVVREERGQLVSYYRTKKFKGAPFSTELKRWV